jgi:glutathione peroxidase-family protein
VNGENAAPVYKFLKLGKWGIFGDDIQWNFAKFLVDKDGQIVDRYYPTTSPLSLEVKASFAVLCLFDSLRVRLDLFFQNM